MKISLIVAMASNRAIGFNNQLPWHLSADLKRFKQLTLGHPILMGRKTHESISRALPGRQNLIITRNADYQATGCLVFNELSAALAHCKDDAELFVIGGGSLYVDMLPVTDTIYLTQIDEAFAGDAFFPEIPHKQWREIERIDITDDAAVSFNYSFIKLVRCCQSDDVRE